MRCGGQLLGVAQKFSPEKKQQIVISVLRGEMSVAEAARRHGSSETSVGKWRDQFVDVA